MARTKECEHTDQYLICSQCDDEPVVRRKPVGALVASFISQCSTCDGTIHPGDWIVGDDDEDNGWSHGTCVYDLTD